jgi:transcriptional regulator with XRE-family HTH domain
MPRRIRGPQARRKTFLCQWREHRGLTLERAIERFIELGIDEMSTAQLSRIENGKSPYTQDILEIAASAYNTDVASLLMRDPSDQNAIWSLWDKAKPGERQMIVNIANTVLKTGT